MSQSLVRRALELDKDDVHEKEKASGSDGSQKKKMTPTKGESLIGLVGTNKKGYRRKLNRMQKKSSAATFKDKKITSLHGIYSQCSKKDLAASNVKALNFLRLMNTTEESPVHKVHASSNQKKAKKRKAAHDGGDQLSAKSEKTNTALTEQDFEKFFRDYDFS